MQCNYLAIDSSIALDVHPSMLTDKVTIYMFIIICIAKYYNHFLVSVIAFNNYLHQCMYIYACLLSIFSCINNNTTYH